MLKNRSSATLQLLPNAAVVTVMSLRPSPPYRNNRNQWRGRSFSNQPDTPANNEVITDNNDVTRQFQPDYNRSYNFRPNYYPRGQQQPPPYSNPYQQFAPPPLYNQNHQFQFQPRGQPPQFRPPVFYNQGQQFRPPQQRPVKPVSDYRNWEHVKPKPQTSYERFTVLSYNILADYLAINHRSKLYFHIPRHILDWEFRRRNIMFELGLWTADILCFQEVDRFQDLEEDLKIRGYSGIWKMRTGEPVDGCAIFWRSSRFKLLHEESIEFNKFGLRDNVAQICVLESLNERSSKESAPPACSEGRNKVVICNIHVLYNPRRGEIKLGQVRRLLHSAYATSRLWDNAPVVLCGDFNSTPKSSLYNFISEQKLNVADLPRDKISGQHSGEIRPNSPFTSIFRTQSTDNTTQSPTRVYNTSSNLLANNTTQKDVNTAPQLEAKEESEGNAVKATLDVSENIKSDAITDDTPDELLEAIKDVSIGEDSTSFLSELHGPDGADVWDGNETSVETHVVMNGSLSSDSKPFVEMPFYNPSGWSPMEIEAATGSSECTTMEHPLKLRSTYSEVQGYSGTRDCNGEPQVTSYHRSFQGTVDYIWRTEGLQTVRVLAPIPKQAMQWTPGFPTKRWGSDHIALVAELAFSKVVNDEKPEAQ